jgi:hypothetical protein
MRWRQGRSPRLTPRGCPNEEPPQPTSANEPPKMTTTSRPSTILFRCRMCSSPLRMDMSQRVINPPVYCLLQGVNVLLDRGWIQSIPMSGSNNVNAVAFARLTSSRLKWPILRGMALRHTVTLRLEACRSQLAFGLIPKGTVVGAKAVPDWRSCRGSSVPKPLGSAPFRLATVTESHNGKIDLFAQRTAKAQSSKAHDLPIIATCPFP